MPRPGDLLARCRLAGHIFRRAGLTGLRQAFAYSRASKTRERNYQTFLREIEPGLLAAEAAAPFPAGTSPPHIGILTPLYNTPPTMLHRCIQSVRAQTYDRWTLCLIDDASTHPHVAAIARSYAAFDPRIRFSQLKENSGISAATNAALAQAVESGCDFIALLDHDDELSPHALRALARRIAENPELELLYTDEDKIPPPNEPESAVPAPMHAASAPFPPPAHRHTPTFKPGFSPHLLLSHNYLCHLLCIRTRLIKEVVGVGVGVGGSAPNTTVLRTTTSSSACCSPFLPHTSPTSPSSSTTSAHPPRLHLLLSLRQTLGHRRRPPRPGRSSLPARRVPDRGAAPLPPNLELHFPPSSPSLSPPFSRPPLPPILRSRTVDPAVLREELRAFAAHHPDAPFLACLHPDVTPISADWLNQLHQFTCLPPPYVSDLIALRLISRSRPRRTLSAGLFRAANSDALTNPFADLPLADPGPNWRLTAPFNADAVSPLCFLIRTAALNMTSRGDPLCSCVIVPDVWVEVPDDLAELARSATFTI